MSKNQKTNKAKLAYNQVQTLPTLRRIKTDWSLRAHYYKSAQDPQIEKDIKKVESAYGRFARKWQKRDFTTSPTLLAQALHEYEKLVAMPEKSKPGRYFSFRTTLNAKDTEAEKQLALLTQRWRKIKDELVYFHLGIAKISQTKQHTFLTHPKLKPFTYYLTQIWESAKHNLTEAEEKIINLKSHQSYGAWVDMTDKLLSNKQLSFDGKSIPFYEALESLDSYPLAKRKKLWSIMMAELEVVGEVAEHEFNAIITDVHTEDTLRGYKKPYSATVLSYQDTEKSVENLVAAVSSTGFDLSKKFYKLKAALHKTKKLHYTQKYDPIGKGVSVPFDHAVDICRDVFYGIKNQYGEIFDSMLVNGQIDVYPKPGKRGGAFMAETINAPTYVMLNHTDNLSSLRTIAHEMGHAIHAERGKTQRPFYQGHSITTAETASTLFENLLFNKLIEQTEGKQKTFLLHDKVAQNIATIQRQIACFNAELEIHNTIAKAGAMTNDELRDCLYRHLKAYLGPAVDVQPTDGYTYVYWSHLRYGFYVYTYSYGILMSSIMARRYQEDVTYVKQIDDFLTAGESADVATIFRSIGIHTTRSDTFTEALKAHEADINAFKTSLKQTHPNKV